MAMLFELLGYGTLFSLNGLIGCNKGGQMGKVVAVAQTCLWTNVTGNQKYASRREERALA